MLCYVRLVFDISPTGFFHSKFIIEGMNIQEYLPNSFWLQGLMEAIVIMWTWWHISREVCYACLEGGFPLSTTRGVHRSESPLLSPTGR